MYFLRASLSVAVLTFFLGATHAKQYDPPHASFTVEQAVCLVTVNGIVYNTCEATMTREPQLQSITPTPLRTKCLVTINDLVFDTCSLFMSTIGNSQITVAPRKSPSNRPEAVNCYTMINGMEYDTCDVGDILTLGLRQPNAACLTTLTAREGHVVVVDCGDGFESGHPPTITSPSLHAAKPTTVCVENRCFDVIGTFGSPASATATPTQTRSKEEL